LLSSKRSEVGGQKSEDRRQRALFHISSPSLCSAQARSASSVYDKRVLRDAFINCHFDEALSLSFFNVK
jgi:hypothetical protein